MLTRDLANQNHYPAIDILRSISRVMEDITDLDHKHHVGKIKEVLATYRKAEDLDQYRRLRGRQQSQYRLRHPDDRTHQQLSPPGNQGRHNV